jgi:hypothetical protein
VRPTWGFSFPIAALPLAAVLRRYMARNNLTMLYQELGRLADAEAQWRTLVAERPDFLPAWIGLGELYLRQERWGEVERPVPTDNAPMAVLRVHSSAPRVRRFWKTVFRCQDGIFGRDSPKCPKGVSGIRLPDDKQGT